MNLNPFRRRPQSVASITSSLNIMAAQLGEHIVASETTSVAIADQIVELINQQDAARGEAARARRVQAQIIALCS